MKEDEAKTKWCPFVRGGNLAIHHGAMVIDHHTRSIENNKCIASECMAWRISHREHDLDTDEITDFGYCGLAGGQ